MSIFDQFGKIATNAAAQAASEPDRPASSGPNRSEYLAQLEKSKAEVTEKITGLFAELGKAYYEAHADDSSTEYEAQLAAVREANTEIAQLQQQTEEISARRRCPACGAQLAEGSRFCNICGMKLPEAPGSAEAPAAEQRLCPKCKAPIGPDDMFCVSCGADLRDTATNGGV